MGCCLSKTNPPPPSSSPEKPQRPHYEYEPKEPQKSAIAVSEKKEERKIEKEEEKLGLKNKEAVILQPRKSHDKRSESKGSAADSDVLVKPAISSEPEKKSPKNDENEGVASNLMAMAAGGGTVRTSSCTKDEVDAILIQCGRLSKSPAGKSGGSGGSAVSGSARKYSGSKRSHDFDRENDVSVELSGDGGAAADDERQRRRQSIGSHRRRTPSRSREREPQAQRSGSRERTATASSGRRVSRSPARRSESPVKPATTVTCRPGKIISVPATVSSLSVEKSSNGGGGDSGNVKRVLVKRNVGEGSSSRGATSPRSQSPARSRSATSPRSRSPARSGGVNGIKGAKEGGNAQQNQQSVSRKSSPHRRTPLTDLDINSLPFQPLANKSKPAKIQQKSKEIEDEVAAKQNKLGVDANTAKVSFQGAHRRSRSRGGEGNDLPLVNYCRVSENRTQISAEQVAEAKREQLNSSAYDAVVTPVIVSGSETLKLPPTLTRSRSARRSRDFDVNVESLLNPNPSPNYNSLLLRDIQNFHQKSNSDSNPPFALPDCISKACSIVEAVADLNSSTNLPGLRKMTEKSKVPFVESEVNPGDDLMEPSFHKYVTVRDRGSGAESVDEQESSGSNSVVAGIQNRWNSSSSWEPNSADSSDCWTSRSRDERANLSSSQRSATSQAASMAGGGR